jgi:hypothetical protein
MENCHLEDKIKMGIHHDFALPRDLRPFKMKAENFSAK